MNTSLKSWKSLVAVMMAVGLVVAVACGGGTTDQQPKAPQQPDEPQQPAMAAPAAPAMPAATAMAAEPAATARPAETAVPSGSGQLAVPTSTPRATAVPAEQIDLPEPKSPQGTITIVLQDVGPGIGLHRAGGGEGAVRWGAAEGMFKNSDYGQGPVFGEPWLVKDWTLASDLAYVDLVLEEGVEFHDGYGEMTAADVVYSLNDANANVTETSIHAQAGDLAAMFGEAEEIDTYTVRIPFTRFDIRWQSVALSQGFQPTGVQSTAVRDQMGEDWMRDNIIGTGHFEVEEWTQDSRIVLTKIPYDHWRKNAQIDRLVVLDIPDPTVRLAQMKTGEADAVPDLQLKDAPPLLAAGFERQNLGGSELNVAWTGNLWETHHVVTGEPLSRGGLQVEKPWIGDPDDPADMEQARLVRTALSEAYDREELVEVLTDGQGWPLYIGKFNPRMPQWDDKWFMPYDPEGAKQKLAQAGFPDGFEIEIFGQSNTLIRQQTAEAIASYWHQNLGLDVIVQSFHYRVFRPSIVGRTASIPFMNSCDGPFPVPWDWPKGLTLSSVSRGGFSCAIESPEVAQAYVQGNLEPDVEKRVALNNAVADHFHHWRTLTGVFTIPTQIIYNPNAIESWSNDGNNCTCETQNIVPAR